MSHGSRSQTGVGPAPSPVAAGRFRLIKMVLMVAPILPPEGAQRVAGWWRSHRDRNPRIATSYDPPRMGRKNINAPMEGLCRCKPMRPIRTLQFLRPSGARSSVGLSWGSGPPQAKPLARSAGRITRLNRPVLRFHKISKISNKEFVSSPVSSPRKPDTFSLATNLCLIQLGWVTETD